MSDEIERQLRELATAVLQYDGARTGITSATAGRVEGLRRRMCGLAAQVLRPQGHVTIQMDPKSVRRVEARAMAQKERDVGEYPDPPSFEDEFGYTPGDQ